MSFNRGTPEEPRAAASRAATIRHARNRAAKAGPEPYAEPFLAFLHAIGRSGPSRAVWRVFWKAADGLPLEPGELAIFQRHTGRETAPTAPARACLLPACRRGGKGDDGAA